MATTKYILEQIKIESSMADLIAKSNGENVAVTYNSQSMTLSEALTKIYASVSSAQTSEDVQNLINTAINGLIDGAPAAYDTLKEISTYLTEHEDAYQLLSTAVTNKADKSDLEALDATVKALGALAKKDTVSETDLASDLKTKINNASAASHTHSNQTVLDGITSAKVQGWDNKAEKTTASATADGLMSSADKTRLDSIRGVRYGATIPNDLLDGELFVRVVSE